MLWTYHGAAVTSVEFDDMKACMVAHDAVKAGIERYNRIFCVPKAAQ
jgi:hypothetical protein